MLIIRFQHHELAMSMRKSHSKFEFLTVIIEAFETLQSEPSTRNSKSAGTISHFSKKCREKVLADTRSR